MRIQTELASQRRYMRVLNICWLGKKHRAIRAAVDCPIEQLMQREGMIRPQNAASRLPPARFRRAGEGFDLGEELGGLWLAYPAADDVCALDHGVTATSTLWLNSAGGRQRTSSQA